MQWQPNHCKSLPEALKTTSFKALCVNSSRSSSEMVARQGMVDHSSKIQRGKDGEGRGQALCKGLTHLHGARLAFSYQLPKQGSLGTPKISSMVIFHRTTDCLKLAGTSGFIWSNPFSARPPRAGCSGPPPGGF